MSRCWMIPTSLWLQQRMNNSCWINLQSLEPHWMRSRGERVGEHCPHELGLPSDVCTGNLAIQTPATLKNILKAGRASPELIEAARLVRCQACEDSAKPPRDHPVGSHFNFEFNAMLGFDVLEMRDHLGGKYSVMSMVDVATGFHMCEVVKEGGGQPTSEACAKALMTKWIAWAG